MSSLTNKFWNDYEDEITLFLILCGDKDRDFLNIPKKKRKIEDYVRLILHKQCFGL